MMKNRINLARWFIARSDVEAAVHLLLPETDEEDRKLLDYVYKYWPHLTNPEAYQRVYEEAGKIEVQVDKAIHEVPKQDRFQLVAWLFHNLSKCTRVLDYGCSRGLWAIHLHNRFGKEWDLYDINALSIEAAKVLVQEHANTPEDFSFHVVLEGKPDLIPNSVDCAILLEILEHVLDPMDLLEQVEQTVRPGGLMIVSVPCGPVEYTMWVDNPERCREHLREYTYADLLSLFSDKKSLYIQYLNYGPEKYTKMNVGHFVLCWIVDGSPFGEIDLSSRLYPRTVPSVILPGI